MKKLFLVALSVIALQSSYAQKIKWEKGNLDVLEGQTQLALDIQYAADMQVAEMPEQKFLEERKKTDNAEKAGSGDLFVENWNKAKVEKYYKRLSDYIFKASKEKVTASQNNAEAKYVLILKPDNIDLGKGKYFGTKPALVDFDIIIAEKAEPSNIVAQGKAQKVKGEAKAPKGSQWIPGGAGAAMDIANRSQNFDATNRIAEAFELMAITVGKAMKK